MTLDSSIAFFIHNNTMIIEGLFVLILVIILFLSVKAFLFPSLAEQAAAGFDLSGIEESLRKILEQAGGPHAAAAPRMSLGLAERAQASSENAVSASASGDAAVASAARDPGLEAELASLKDALQAKEQELQSLKNRPPMGASTGEAPVVANEESQKMQERIKQLEGKLAEYEIIEEDIADLSFFKEENVKLANEIELLKAQLENATKAPTAAEPPPAAPEIEASAGIQKSGLLSQDFVNAAFAEAASPPAPADAAPVADPESDDIMSEFAAAVEEQKSGAQLEVEKQVSVPKSVIHEDLKTPEAASAQEPEPLDLNVNVDKMMTEALDLSTADGPEVQNALESELNTDKLLLEATDLEEKK